MQDDAKAGSQQLGCLNMALLGSNAEARVQDDAEAERRLASAKRERPPPAAAPPPPKRRAAALEDDSDDERGGLAARLDRLARD